MYNHTHMGPSIVRTDRLLDQLSRLSMTRRGMFNQRWVWDGGRRYKPGFQELYASNLSSNLSDSRTAICRTSAARDSRQCDVSSQVNNFLDSLTIISKGAIVVTKGRAEAYS